MLRGHNNESCRHLLQPMEKKEKTSTKEWVQKACRKDSDKTDNHHHSQVVIQPSDKETFTLPTFDPSSTATRILKYKMTQVTLFFFFHFSYVVNLTVKIVLNRVDFALYPPKVGSHKCHSIWLNIKLQQPQCVTLYHMWQSVWAMGATGHPRSERAMGSS